MQWGENESYYTYFIKLFTRTLSYRKRKKLGRIMGLGTPQNIYYQMPHINMHSYFTMKPISLFGNIQELQINFFFLNITFISAQLNKKHTEFYLLDAFIVSNMLIFNLIKRFISIKALALEK